MAEDKAQLLKSLQIDRSGAEAPVRRRYYDLLVALFIDRSGAEAPARLRYRWPLVAFVAVALVGASGALAFYGFSDHRAIAARPSPVPTAMTPDAAGMVSAEAATKTKPTPSHALVASGYVVARRKATVAAEVTGKVVEVLVEEGSVVKQGDVLARLDTVLEERDLALAQSRANAAQAAIGAFQADLSEAERVYSRDQYLVAHTTVSEAELTRAGARVGVLQAQLKQAEAQFETAKLEEKRTADTLEKHNIRAPFSGVVVERSAQPGEMISPLAVGGFTRTGICTLIDMDSLEVDVDVNETFVGRLKPGMAVDVTLDAYPDWTIPASVIAVAPTASREKATVGVRIGFKVKDPRILPEMAVKIAFEPDQTAADGGKSAAN